MQPAIQDLLGPTNHCHGCGTGNPKGLQIKSHIEGDECVCRFRPQPHHCAGAENIVNGGIIASLIDCHSVNFAMARAYQNAGRAIGSQPQLWCVTATLSVTYKRPTPIDAELELRAKITKQEGRKSWISCTLSARGEICASGEVLAVQVERG